MASTRFPAENVEAGRDFFAVFARLKFGSRHAYAAYALRLPSGVPGIEENRRGAVADSDTACLILVLLFLTPHCMHRHSLFCKAQQTSSVWWRLPKKQ
jgi:hypothetical protein